MARTIDLTKTVYELASEHEDFVDIMASLGFTEIRKKVMLNSVGKLMTVPKGAKMKRIPMEQIVAAFKERGYEVTGYEGAEAKTEQPQFTYVQSDSRTEQLKGYLRRLSAGEDLESVRKDFAEKFSSVEAAEIMRAEQELMKEGTPLKEVQKLCDIHSALFHGKTREERIANTEKEVAASVQREKLRERLRVGDGTSGMQEKANVAMAKENEGKAAELRAINGHPVQTFYRENEALEALLAEDIDLVEKVRRVRAISIHYAKKGDLLYPHLKVKYDITGPSTVMWTVDDEIRDTLSALDRQSEHDGDWMQRAEAVLQRAEEMIFKENNILLPLCAANFSEDEWKQIYRDSKQYNVCLGVEPKVWNDAEQQVQAIKYHEGEIVMPGGHLTIEQLTAMLDTFPIEITFVDADNINRYFNDGPQAKVFKRPQMAIDREVFSCHPPKIEPMVRAIIDDFRSGRRDQVPVWMEKQGRAMLVLYMAVRDKQGQYLGTVEMVQDMEFAREHFMNYTNEK